MRNDRRVFLAAWLAAAGAPLWLRAQPQNQDGSALFGQQGPTKSTSQPTPPITDPSVVPSVPDIGSASDTNSDSDSTPNPNPRAVLKQDRKELQRDADALVEMAADLKKQVDSLDTTQVLSLDLVHKAESVEKLAHQIKMLMQER